jgi:hypothetical protein
MGPKTSNTYFHQSIETIKLNGDSVKITPPAMLNTPIEMELSFQKPVSSGDGIYVFTDKTYMKRKTGKKILKKSDYYRFT